MLIAGVDEAGRGPLAGPVIAAAVVYNTSLPADVADSKTCTEKKRTALARIIKSTAYCWAIGEASVAEIDALNIHHATLLAMSRAVAGLTHQPDHVQVDGKFTPDLPMSSEAIIKGDSLVPVISAASLIAKTTRDALLIEYDRLYPNYGFANHKGYGTKAHLEALKAYGALPIHRRSFAPVKAVMAASGA